MAGVTATFPTAPRDRRVYIALFVSVFAGLVGVVAGVYTASLPTAHKHNASLAVVLITPAATALIGIILGIREAGTTAQFQIEDDVLVLDRKRFPLTGATEVVRDPLVLKGACRIWGNRGLLAFRGQYRSKRLGRFYAFLTSADHAVVVRWPDRAVAVSPADPEFFMYSARKAAGLAT